MSTDIFDKRIKSMKEEDIMCMEMIIVICFDDHKYSYVFLDLMSDWPFLFWCPKKYLHSIVLSQWNRKYMYKILAIVNGQGLIP